MRALFLLNLHIIFDYLIKLLSLRNFLFFYTRQLNYKNDPFSLNILYEFT